MRGFGLRTIIGTDRGMRAGVAALIVLVLVVGLGWGFAYADKDAVVGRALSGEQLTAVYRAGHACPALTSARLAGQLMVESELDPAVARTTSGGRGIAGLTDEQWRQWAPWPGAQREDTAASVLALAHLMCNLVGQVRASGVDGDAWRLALGAFLSGVATVREAGRVPGKANDYVAQAGKYAAYYESLPQFASAGSTAFTGASSAPEAVPLPDELVGAVVAAGSRCPEVRPAAIAGQLMALSGFNAEQRGASGQLGIAGFSEDLWQDNAPKGASVWNPQEAVPVMGDALCRLVRELTALPGDPYLLAAAAWQSGVDTVRRAGGVPDVMTRAYLENAAAYTDYYQLDSRLAPSSAPSVSPSPSSVAASPSVRPPAPTKGAPAATRGASNPAPPPATTAKAPATTSAPTSATTAPTGFGPRGPGGGGYPCRRRCRW
ncbi:ricin-type beta-trefoil lectin domain protein [Micromonospora chokoriensis]